MVEVPFASWSQDADEDTRSLYPNRCVAGCDVVDAADGRDALVKAFVHRPSVVITETQPPIFDGYALCQVLRHDSVTGGVPIVVVTSEARSNELDRARGAARMSCSQNHRLSMRF